MVNWLVTSPRYKREQERTEGEESGEPSAGQPPPPSTATDAARARRMAAAGARADAAAARAAVGGAGENEDEDEDETLSAAGAIGSDDDSDGAAYRYGGGGGGGGGYGGRGIGGSAHISYCCLECEYSARACTVTAGGAKIERINPSAYFRHTARIPSQSSYADLLSTAYVRVLMAALNLQAG